MPTKLLLPHTPHAPPRLSDEVAVDVVPPLPSAPAGMRTYTPLVTMHRHDPAAGRFAKGYRGRNTGAPPDHEEIDDKSINPATGWRWEDEEHAEL